MSTTYNDNYTKMLDAKMTDWGLERIYEIEDNIEKLEENEEEIIKYLNNIRYSLPLGIALRRYICTKFGIKTKDGYKVTLSDEKSYILKDFQSDDYDLQNDDIKEYIEIFQFINEKYNTDESGNLSLEVPKPEIRRLLRSTTYCLRSKMFLLSFALHMNNKEMEKFLTDVLAEQTYNYRDPEEIISMFCQYDERINTYPDYLRIKAKFSEVVKKNPIDNNSQKEDYTAFARVYFENEIKTEEELIAFLISNIPNFAGYSQTAYNEFMILYHKALKKTKFQLLSNDEYLSGEDASTPEKLEQQKERIDRAIGLQDTKNSEQLAKAMMYFYPRANSKRNKDGKDIISNDFISISNGETGQKSKKVQTTTLPKEITMNMLVSDRLDDLRKQIKPVTRKDLVFMRFYVFSLDLIDKGSYLQSDYRDFIDECNSMLVRCGMSRLYPANRFENLILLSLLSSNPFEMFENIIEYSFINEPEFEE
ncbi:MAG: hypothetical protein ACI4HN_05355 [Ruminococcus sp.]